MPQNNPHNGRTAALARELRDRAADAEVAALPDVTCKMNMVSGGILQRAEGPPLKFNKHLDGGIDLFDARQRTSPPLQRAIRRSSTSLSAGLARLSPMSSRTNSPALKPSESPFSVLSTSTPTTRHPEPRRRIGPGSRLATPQAAELPEVAPPPHPPGLEWWSQLAAAVAAAVGCNGAPTSRAGSSPARDAPLVRSRPPATAHASRAARPLSALRYSHIECDRVCRR